ncbi:low-density lipoprotein receptor-related protein 1B-like [Trichogramma pretiosum]|uniref:low-density lipoprotein receptor-related protein 1B-like n=1 Tax=Trichogramma pretiosum TaxID=7493 RepID=UPI000C7191E1|nr:low-density lipoprotein receptor-related protein 1B-like [Trichogramma pretiosum]
MRNCSCKVVQSQIMQFSQNQDASEFEVDVEFQNENENQTYRNFLHSKFTQIKMLYKTNRKYFFIGFIIVMLVIMDIINVSLKINPTKSNSLDATNQVDLINKDCRNKTECETAPDKKELKFEFFTTETSTITTHQSTSTEFDRYPQKTDFYNLLLFLEGKSIWLLDLETEYHHNLHEVSNYISAFYFNFKGELIWFEDQSKTTHSLADEYNGLSLPPNLKIKAIADDFSTGDSYALDEEGEHLLIFDQNYHYSSVIVSDLKNATDLKIDPFARLVFILANGEILRCNMDGKSLKTLSLRNDINSFALDYKSKKIYVLGKTIIEYSNYEGKARHFFYKLETFNHVTSLTYQNDKLFWMQQDEQSLQHIMYCEVNKLCQTPSKITLVFEKLVSKVIAFPNKSELTTVANPCQQVPSVCDHICILGANNTYTCACDQFHHLEDDRKTCKLTVHYLIYFYKNSFRGKFIDNFSSSSNDLIPFLPVYFNYEVKQYHDKIVFGKGSKDFEIFFSDSKNFYILNLRTTEQESIFRMNPNWELTTLEVYF